MHDTTRSHRLLDAAAWLLFGLAVLKMAVVVLARPVFGYANSYDFVRQSACMGLWQSVPGVHKYEGSYETTAASLLYDGETLPQVCLFSSDNLFAHLAATFHSVGDRVDWAWIAWPKLLLVILPVALLLTRMSPALKFASAFAFLLVFGDPIYLGYVNTLYTDFSVVGAGSVLALAIASRIERAPARDRLTSTILVLSLAWLGMSKLQYAFLTALVAVLYAAWLVKGGHGRAAWIAVLAGVLAPVAYLSINSALNNQLDTFRQTNRIDTVFGAVLPAAPDRTAALATLGLSQHCRELIGKTWYAPDGPRYRPCEGLNAVGYGDLLRLFLQQPATFFRPLVEGLRQARPLYPTYLGNRQGLQGFVDDPQRLARRTALSSSLVRLPELLYLAVFPVSLAVGGMAGLWLVVRRHRLTVVSRGALALASLGGLYAGYALASSVFGDGYIEVQKHTSLYGVGLFLQLAAGVAAVAAWAGRGKQDPAGADVRV
ncbi:glycan biosynthesis hexose transferase WsfD [Pseudomonas mangiferae]|uniref:Glycosyltransferase RgtA/B/C/D-like domain-containing protein n=1 Tax=Pseudomonas mangiferae TaxID=2593654 RepID=A0A553GTX3_9PSED|nr:hypothetical protein [Pseudomonas mangiferae]TRX72957.1 hypothetical protein FM069_20085 [Pseudomonas mangiferae]